MKKVSVIVPIYGVEKYIKESVQSICRQEYKDIELILVNDGTLDHSMELALEIVKKHHITAVIVNKSNGGLPSARNAGIRVATGEMICFIDSDDIISPNHVSDLVEACEKYDTKVSYADFQLTYENCRKGVENERKSAGVLDRKTLLHDFMIRKIRIHCCALLIDRQYLLEKNIFFNENLKYGEDIDFMWRLFPSLDAIAYTGCQSYKYLQRPNSLMTQQSKERVLKLLEEFENTVKILSKQYPDDGDVFDFLYGKAALAFYRTFAESAPYALFKELLSESNYRKRIFKVVFIGNLRISCLAIVLLVSPRLFSTVVKCIRETVRE